MLLNMSDTSDKEVKSSRTPRKRAARQSATASVRADLVRPKKVEDVVKEEVIQSTSLRKSPTAVSSNRRSLMMKRRRYAVMVTIFAIGMSSSVALGYSDKGFIDVAEVINERNRKAQESGDTTMVSIPVQNRNLPADGGLVGMGDLEVTPSQTESTTTVASSTEETATTTDEEMTKDTTTTQ
jgi:hypothetical protein